MYTPHLVWKRIINFEVGGGVDLQMVALVLSFVRVILFLFLLTHSFSHSKDIVINQEGISEYVRRKDSFSSCKVVGCSPYFWLRQNEDGPSAPRYYYIWLSDVLSR
jgi:hypothetical protein